MKRLSKVLLLCLSIFVLQCKSYANNRTVDSLVQLLKNANADSVRIDLHVQLSNVLLATDYKQSLFHANSAVKLAENTEDYIRKIKSYKVAGAVCMYMGLNDLSVKFYTKYYELAESKNDQTEMGAASFNLASVQMALNNYAKAKEDILYAGEQLREAYRMKGKSLPENILLMYNMNLGIIYMNLGEFNKADSMVALALPLAKGVLGMEPQLLKLYHFQAILYIREKKLDKGLAAVRDARLVAERLGDVAGLTAIYQSAGEIYQEKGDIKSAIREYSEGYKSAAAIGGIALQGIMAESLYRLYQQIGKGDSAIKYFNLFTAHKDKSKSEEAKSQLMREELLRDYKKMEDQLKKQTGSEKLSYLYFTLFFLVFAAFGFIGTIRYRRRFRRLELEQTRKDLEAKRIELEKERLALQLADKEKQLSELEYRLSKNAMLETLVTELQSTYVNKNRAVDGDSIKTETSKLVQQGKIWEEFEVRFAKTHGDFYDRLVKAFPDITLNERRLCAFLKLDMTTKEISTITGQSVRAIEIARTRLRKKLNLNQSDTSLFEFLSSI